MESIAWPTSNFCRDNRHGPFLYWASSTSVRVPVVAALSCISSEYVPNTSITLRIVKVEIWTEWCT